MRSNRANIIRLFLLACCAFASTVTADDIRESTHSIAKVPTKLNPAESETAAFNLRIYDDRGGAKTRLRDIDQDFHAIDVYNELTICADGSAQLRAISLGSWQFDLDGECADDAISSDIEVVWDKLRPSDPD